MGKRESSTDSLIVPTELYIIPLNLIEYVDFALSYFDDIDKYLRHVDLYK